MNCAAAKPIRRMIASHLSIFRIGALASFLWLREIANRATETFNLAVRSQIAETQVVESNSNMASVRRRTRADNRALHSKHNPTLSRCRRHARDNLTGIRFP